jgi:hypothetical protein
VDRKEAQAALDSVGKAMTSQYADQPDRLHQLLAHLATVSMVVGQMFDHAENAAADKEG